MYSCGCDMPVYKPTVKMYINNINMCVMLYTGVVGYNMGI